MLHSHGGPPYTLHGTAPETVVLLTRCSVTLSCAIAEYDTWKAAWSYKPHKVRTSVPQLRIPLNGDQQERLATAATQAGLSEQAAKRVVAAAKMGLAPLDPVILRNRISCLLGLEKSWPGLNMEQILKDG